MPNALSFAIGSDSVVEAAIKELVRVERIGDRRFINMPMFYPSGSYVTVRVTSVGAHFVVDDGGYAYRELEDVGLEKSFSRAAQKIAPREGLSANSRMVFQAANSDELPRAICDVAMASKMIVDRSYRRLSEEAAIADDLTGRLERIFGRESLSDNAEINGASTNPWKMSAILKTDRGPVVFQAVSNHANSIYRASTAFHDLEQLPKPPKRVAVVRDLSELGPRLNMLAQAARVIESEQTDEVYRRLAA